MMKLQKQLSRKYGDKEYAKWVVIIPPSKVEELEWEEGEELNIKVTDGKIILERSKQS